MYLYPTLDRTTLDDLIKASHEAIIARDSIESCCSPEWRAAHNKASEACLKASTERKRLWKQERWGKWMNALDRQLATITGEL